MEIRILDPHLPFVEVDQAFTAAGWHGGATVAIPPLVAGEPEFAAWRRRGTVVRYDADPVVWLRALRIDGPEPVPDLPRLNAAGIAVLLDGPDRAGRLLGVLAIGELGLIDPALLAKVRRLATQGDPLVAPASRAVLRSAAAR
ncbi:hypothetical protein ACIBQ1_03495 [Nonomuraea sp. NPDC050153]|uniref:hypothetical protein n=1 Tax=Nonomuraea sp. NPDC050153 TaxID=3364359 RepID=UPI0037AB86D9